jgi:hypothetical protein
MVAVTGTAGYVRYRAALGAAKPAISSPKAIPSVAPNPDLLVDPLVPSRPVMLDRERHTDADGWVRTRPRFQYSHTAAERGGTEPCSTQAVDASSFGDWVPLSRGKLVVPRDGGFDAQGNFDLVIHLHGDEPIRRELILSGQHFVLYALTLPENESYAPAFNGQALEAKIAEIEQVVSKNVGRAVHARHVVISAWSAGFVGVGAVLARQSRAPIDAAILVDGLHAPRGDRAAFEAQLKPFVDYAKRAAAGDGFFVITHSSIDPPGFASTTECAHYLLDALGAVPQAVKRDDALGLELVEYFDRGNLHVRGYAGNDKADHCAQIGTLRDTFAALGRRFAAPPR